jgi:endonuclease/exonuclease/phosphatase family metal-dependent hydrolase
MSGNYDKLTWEKLSLDTFQWDSVNTHNNSNFDNKDDSSIGSVGEGGLNVGHLNVLVSYPVLGPRTMRSQERYEYIVTKIMENQAKYEVFNFNEANPMFDDILRDKIAAISEKSAERCEVHYVTSCIEQDARERRGILPLYYPSLMSFLPIKEVYAIPLPRVKRRSVVALVITKSGEPFMVCSTHLYAPQSKHEVRAAQLWDLMEQIGELSKRDFVSQDFKMTWAKKRLVILGDFNFHYPMENAIFPKLNLVDCWRELYGNQSGRYWVLRNEGITWDCSNIWWLPFDNRRMRLDRTVMPNEIQGYTIHNSEVIFDEPLAGEAVCCCLKVFPSDHYGLSLSLKRTEDRDQVFNSKSINLLTEEEDKTPKRIHGRNIKMVLLLRVASLAAIGGLLYAIFKFVPKAF